EGVQGARGHAVGGGAVEAADARPALAGEGGGGQPGAVVDGDDVDLLALEQVGRVHEVGIDRARAHVVQVGLRDGGPVDLGLEHGALHQISPCTSAAISACWAATVASAAATKPVPIATPTLSMSRVVPTRAATRRRPGPSSGGSPRSPARSSR